MRLLILGFVAGLIFVASPSSCLSKTLHVPADYPTIQAAINAASAVTNDTVLVSPGTYNEAVNFNGKPTLLISANGPGATIIQPPAGSSAITFSSGESSNSILSGFTLTNGGISISFTSPTIISNTIVNTGTAIYSDLGSPIIRNNTIAGSTGHGIFISAVAVGTTIIVDNYITGCGDNAVFLYGKSAGGALIQGNSIENNSVSGIALWSSGSTMILDNLIENNQQDGIHTDYADANIVQNVILNNKGNGIYSESPYESRGPWIINNSVAGNGGKGIWIDNFWADDCEIDNNIVVGNPALDLFPLNPREPYVVRFNDFYSSEGLAYLSSDVSSTNVSAFNLNATNSEHIDNNISSNPFFACLPSGDCHLLAGSTCIQSGSALALLFPATDFDGITRTPVPNPNQLADLGAYAFDSASPPTPCLYLNCPSNIVTIAVAGQDSAAVNYPSPDATPGSTVSCLPASGTLFPAGTNEVICTFVYGTNILTGNFTITVVVPPYITNQQSIVSVLANGNATLSVGAFGTTPMAYQWTFAGAPIANATNSTLTVFNAQATDEGFYQVILTNAFGTATSQNIYLRVLPSEPLVVSGPYSISVPAGSQAMLAATVIGSAPLTLQWYKDGALLSGANSFQLVISNAQAADAGAYQLLVSNFLGTSVSSAAKLTVMPAKPSFVLQPVSIGEVVGSSAAFESLATGSDDGLDPIQYAWYFQNYPLSGQTGPNLALASIKADSQGAYYVVASNAHGTATSDVAQLTVYLPPWFQPGLSNLVVEAGKSVALNPGATGTPPLAYSWNFNITQLSNTAAVLSLSNITPSQSGFYSVTVTNQYGSASTTGRVSVIFPACEVKAWGDDSEGQTDVPTNSDDAVAVAGGDYHSVAIRRDGTLIAWGFDGYGQIDVPTNSLRFVSIAVGADHNLAIAEDGSVAAWGRDNSGQVDVPTTVTDVLNVAAGASHSLALLESGTVVAWGDDSYGQTDLPLVLTGYWWYNWWYEWFYAPPQPAQAIAAGYNHSLALMYDGRVVGWGDNSFGQTSVPANLTNAVAVAAGYAHSAALLSNGTVLAWGDNSFGQTNVPAGLTNVIAIEAGDFHTLALLSNGNIVGWGDDTFGQLDTPSGATDAIGIASGYYTGMALVPFRAFLQAKMTGAGLVIQWNGTGVLQWAPTPGGPYTDLPCRGNNWTNSNISAGAQFFRLRSQ